MFNITGFTNSNYFSVFDCYCTILNYGKIT